MSLSKEKLTGDESAYHPRFPDPLLPEFCCINRLTCCKRKIRDFVPFFSPQKGKGHSLPFLPVKVGCLFRHYLSDFPYRPSILSQHLFPSGSGCPLFVIRFMFFFKYPLYIPYMFRIYSLYNPYLFK